MADSPRALIVGGSVGGLFAALLLRRIGWDAIVFERATGDLASRGAAIGTTKQLLDVMAGVGLRVEELEINRVRSYVALDRTGAVAHIEPRGSLTAHWSSVYRPLRLALPDSMYRAGMALERVEQTAHGVSATFADGSRLDGDLLIGADGIHSAVRQEMIPAVQPRYAGYVAWRGVVEEKDVAPADHELIFNHLVFEFTETELVLCIPLPPERAPEGGVRPRRSCYIWYRPAGPAKLRDLFTDATGKEHGVSIAPQLIRSELIDELKATSARQFAPLIAGIIARAGRPLLQAISDLATTQMVFGRVLLLGDAAFVARPHAVAGVTKAALDAQCLADLIEGHGLDLSAALGRYDEQRRAFGQALVAHAQGLGAFIEAASGNSADRPHVAPDPAVMLRNYGAPHLLGSLRVSDAA